MTAGAWAQLGVLIAILLLTTPALGAYLARVYGDGAAPGDRVFGPVDRGLYRLLRVDPSCEQPWPVYAAAVLAFSAVSVLVLYGLQRAQGGLPLNPTDVAAVPPAVAFNTAVSFVTNTNWQSYGGEATMSHLTQVAGLAVQNFVSAAVGMTVAIALVRGIARRRATTIGNFWVDLVRTTTRVLLPIAFVAALVLAGRGVVQNLHDGRLVTTLDGSTQVIPGGPVASQEAIKELGTNGGGFYNANSAHPFENPDAATNLLQLVLILVIPFALTFTFGSLVRDRRTGWAVFAAMFTFWIASVGIATAFEVNGNGSHHPTIDQTAGNLEGKEVRFGSASSALYAATTTGTSSGAVISSHDSFTPGGGAVPLVNMMLGEVSPGGVGAGLYGMLIFAILAVFIAGLMVGRTPELLGKKIQAAEMKLVALYVLAGPIVVLGFSAASVALESAKAGILNPGPHGLSEVVYAFTSAANNNGSAFGGLAAGTDWYAVTLGLAMLAGRFLLIVPVLALAGTLARKQPVPVTSGTFPTGTPLFAGLLTGVVLIVVGLTFFPVLALGPLAEQLGQ